MRKIKLQMTISIDGFVKPQHGGEDPVWDDEVTDFCLSNLDNVDAILLGRNTAEGFIPHWAEVSTNPNADYYILGKPLTDIPKIVFSNKLKGHKWDNSRIVNGDLKTEIENLKLQKGKDIIVYGGHSFVSALIQHGLVDEFYLLVKPFAAGSGEPIFKNLENNLSLTLKSCRQFHCGIVLLWYERRK